jgi:hypothetical protein
MLPHDDVRASDLDRWDVRVFARDLLVAFEPRRFAFQATTAQDPNPLTVFSVTTRLFRGAFVAATANVVRGHTNRGASTT